MTGIVTLAVGLLADDAPRHTGPDFGKASPVGLLIIVVLMIGTFVLIWSMNRHLKKLPERFDRGHVARDRSAGRAVRPWVSRSHSRASRHGSRRARGP